VITPYRDSEESARESKSFKLCRGQPVLSVSALKIWELAHECVNNSHVNGIIHPRNHCDIARVVSALPCAGWRDHGTSSDELAPACGCEMLNRPRLEMVVLTAVGVIALGLACIGLYGLIAYSVAQRIREIGIRVALGASKAGIFLMILGDGFRLTVVGVLLGLAGVLSSTRLLRSLLYEVNPLDPATLVSVICILLVVSAVACYIPALRATNADPASILREE
jgi:ABC-type antimicrobial peptide transport system permease subunit